MSGARSALGGLRVLEFGASGAVAYAGKLLAEFGADVVKVEGAEWDPARGRIRMRRARQADGALHRWINNNKRSLVLGAEEAVSLDGVLDGADGVLSPSFPDGVGSHA